METKTTDKAQAVKAVYNNDCAVIDFLADLHDREPLKALERYVKWSHQEPLCHLHNCPEDNLVVLILYKAPFGLNEGDNKLILYAHNTLAGLYNYFVRWRNCSAPSIRGKVVTDEQILTAVDDIIKLIGLELVDQLNNDDNVQLDFMG